jgi:hypothetical protein
MHDNLKTRMKSIHKWNAMEMCVKNIYIHLHTGFPIVCIINNNLFEMLIWWICRRHNVIVVDVSHIQDYKGKLDAK